VRPFVVRALLKIRLRVRLFAGAEIMRAFIAALAISALFAVSSNAQTQSTQPPPNCDAPAHHALDFWIGEWDAYRADNDHLAGRSSITASDGGCVINEHWTSLGAPYTGRSLNTFDSASGKWEQYWADSAGNHLYFIGGVQEGGAVSMATTGPSDAPGPNGQRQWQRVTFTPLPDGSVRQQGDVSPDGRTWTLSYALIYRHHHE
jgi:hypothetical protein